jgi:hypothetical protein
MMASFFIFGFVISNRQGGDRREPAGEKSHDLETELKITVEEDAARLKRFLCCGSAGSGRPRFFEMTMNMNRHFEPAGRR